MPAADATPPRKRGAQPGNVNAVTSGFYRRARLTAHTFDLLQDSRDHATVDDVVDLLRAEMVRMVEAGDYDHRNLAALAAAIFKGVALAAKLTPAGKSELEEALDNVLADLRTMQETTA